MVIVIVFYPWFPSSFVYRIVSMAKLGNLARSRGKFGSKWVLVKGQVWNSGKEIKAWAFIRRNMVIACDNHEHEFELL